MFFKNILQILCEEVQSQRWIVVFVFASFVVAVVTSVVIEIVSDIASSGASFGIFVSKFKKAFAVVVSVGFV